MNVLLIYPPSVKYFIAGDDTFAVEPLALEYVGAAIADKHEVKLLDLRFEKNFEETIRDFKPDIVGLTGYTFHVNAIKAISYKVKELKPDALVMVGGHHATVIPEDFYEPFIDIVIVGEGILTLKEILKKLEKKEDFSSIQGTAVNVNGGFKFSGPRFLSDLDALPFPDRGLSERVRYSLFQEEMKDIALVITSKGCPFRCNFCCCWKITDGKYLIRKPENIIEELKTIKESNIHFADDESFIDLKRMRRLADLLEKEGINKKYVAYVRTDTVINHVDLLRRWKEVGLTTALLGLESHTQEYLTKYNKKNSIGNNNKAIEILKNMGIDVAGNFIIRPDFTEKDFDNFAEYISSVQIDFPYFNILTPLPGSQLYEQQKAMLSHKNFDLFDFSHTVLPTKLPLKRFYAELSHLYIKAVKVNMKRQKGRDIQSDFTDAKFHNFINKQKKAYLDHEKKSSLSDYI